MPYKAISAAVASSNNVANPLTLTPIIPAVRVVGDLLVAITSSRSITATVATPAGWTLWPGFPKRSATASGGTIYVFYKEVVGGEANPALIWSGLTTGTTGDSCQAVIVCLDRVEVASPSDVTPPAATDASSAHPSIPTLTTVSADAEVIGIALKVSDTGQTGTIANSFTERGDFHTTTGTGHHLYIATRTMGAPGATGASVVTESNATAARCLAVALAVKERIPVTYYGVISRPFTFGSNVKGINHKAILYDDFNRPDGPVYADAGAALWTVGRLDYVADTNSRVIGNALGQNLAGGNYEQAVSTQKLGPGDFDLLLDCVALGSSPNEIAIWFLADNVGVDSANLQGYVLISSSLNQYWAIRKFVNGVNQGVIAGPDTNSPPIGPGDTIWIMKRDSGFYFYRRRVGESFSELMVISFSDPTGFSEGYIAIETSDPSIRWDNIRGSFAPAAPKTLYGSTSLQGTFGSIINGQRQTFSQIDRPFIFGAVTEGKRKVFGQLALPITFSKDVKGQRKTFGQLLSPFIFGKDVRGQRKTFGQTTFPITVGIGTAGFRVGLTQYGIIALPVIFGKDVRGQRKTFGQVAMPLTFNKDVRGQRKTFGQVVFPIIFTKEAVGRKNVFGQLSMQTLFGKETAGRRKTFSQLAMPITFSKAVVGRRQTFGQVALPITFVAFVNGQSFVGPKTYYGQLVMPLTFNKQVAAQRKTFGQVTSPFIFGSASQGQRRTFGELDLPIDFEAAVKSGRVGAHGVIELELIWAMDTNGVVRPVGVILNDALGIYLGMLPVQAVYAEGQKVWP